MLSVTIDSRNLHLSSSYEELTFDPIYLRSTITYVSFDTKLTIPCHARLSINERLDLLDLSLEILSNEYPIVIEFDAIDHLGYPARLAPPSDSHLAFSHERYNCWYVGFRNFYCNDILSLRHDESIESLLLRFKRTNPSLIVRFRFLVNS